MCRKILRYFAQAVTNQMGMGRQFCLKRGACTFQLRKILEGDRTASARTSVRHRADARILFSHQVVPVRFMLSLAFKPIINNSHFSGISENFEKCLPKGKEIRSPSKLQPFPPTSRIGSRSQENGVVQIGEKFSAFSM